MSQTELLVVLSTAPSAEVASEIAKALVEARLVACVNIVPGVRSIYRWEGKLCEESEVLCIMKTRRAQFAALKEKIVSLHPYDVPEVIALDIAGGHLAYLEWVAGST